MINKFKNRGSESEGLKTITGLVTPTEWDEDDNIIAISISTPEEEEYQVKEGTSGKKLLQLIHQYVNVTGLIDENEYGEKTIFVKSYELIKDK